ncbi:MAG: DUF2812 domain-containing protein [Lachnospiraceae bacterium]|nr:DUF2812 domain-containing protein [Lachnospiraceae bacterium]
MPLLSKKYYRLAPCPYYDVESMERWLEAEAMDGYFLIEDGFLFGVGTFEKKEPCHVRYRLEPKEVLDWSAESLFPSAEARELCEEYGWTYIADRGKFFIYRSETDVAREMNTDPKVQALALKPMWDHANNQFWGSLFWIVGYPAIRYLTGRQSLLRICIDMGTWLFILGLAIGLWLLIRSVIRLSYIARRRRQLSRGESMSVERRAWTQEEFSQVLRKKRRTYWLSHFVYMLLIIVWTCCVFRGCAKELEYADQIPLDEYVSTYRKEYVLKHGDEPEYIFPFADMVELVERSLGDESLSFVESGMYPGRMNYVNAKKDLLASTVIRFNQNGSVALPDGRKMEAILYVDYYDTTMPWVAKVLVWEYLKEGQINKHYSEISLPELPVDEAYCFMAYSPTLTLRKEDVVMVVELVQFHYDENDYTLDPSQWAMIFAESMRYQ